MTLRALLRPASTLVAILVLAACGDDITFPPEFDASLNVDLDAMTKTTSGLYYQDLAVGTGPAAGPGDRATVGYAGWLPNGQMFDSGAFSFTLGIGEVIPGFDEGVRGMQAGGKRKLVIHPDLGYGAQSNGPIPANSTLVFEVELQKLN